MSSSRYSICIPHVYNNISDERIYDVFDKYNLGTVSSIEMKRRTGTDKHQYKTVFVHFSEWNNGNVSAVNLKTMIDDPSKEAKLVYDDPWYWVLLPHTNTNKKQYPNKQYLRNSSHANHSPSMKNKKMTLENCYSRITTLEHELTRLYKRISSRVYPESSLSLNSVVTPITYPMTMDELSVDVNNTDIDSGELHKHPLANCYSDNSTLTSDSDDDYSHDNMSYYNCYSPTKHNEKVWMTSNVCGNN